MMITLSKRTVAAIAGAAIAAGMLALVTGQGAATSAGRVRAEAPAGAAAGVRVVQDATGTAAQAAAVRYWTPARMAAAVKNANTHNPGKTVRTVKKRPARKPVSRERRLTRKPPPAPVTPVTPVAPVAPAKPPTPWLTGDTAGEGLRWTHAGAVAADVGKIFFTLAGDNYVCSGTLVGGGHPDVVLTAAHCVTSTARGGGPQWATNWMFVPGYRDGLRPYGEYTARRFFVTPDWTGLRGGSEQYDVAFVQVAAATLFGVSGAAEPPPGLPVEFARAHDAAPPNRAYVFGYPSEPPYSGLYPNYCAGPVTASGGTAATRCGMTAGDSGGPWLAGFRPRSGNGPVVAVSTYKLSGNPRVLYGAVLGPQARALYQQAIGLAR
ncbi:MAG: trypsin-like serine peptidase [Trebonia sp.]